MTALLFGLAGVYGMISLRLALLFALEFFVGVLLCLLVWQFSLFSVPVGAILVVTVVAFYLARVTIVLVEFVLAHLFRSPREPEMQLSPGATAMMVITEIAYFLMVMMLFLPLARRLVTPRRGTITTSKQLPVLFIHGYVCNKGIWAPMLSYLWRRGLSNLYTLDLSAPFGDIEDYVKLVAARVDRICEATRSPKVILVGHSMGGLVARAYMERSGGVSRVAKMISIGVPHHGTILARLAPGANASQMRMHSVWLDELNRDENVRSSVQHVNIYSVHDNIVVPQASAELGVAHNIPLKGKGHFGLVFSKEVGQIVYREVAATRADQQAA
jgi:triacylglycerol esterase/lipase EstA (alpha/beta hydrolase family)